MWNSPDNVTAALGWATRHIQAKSLEDYLRQMDAVYRAEMGEDLKDNGAQRAFSVHPDQIAEMEDAQVAEIPTEIPAASKAEGLAPLGAD